MRPTLLLSILLALAGCKKPFDHGSHYVLGVREAKTARVVATKTVDVKVEHCPILVLGNTAADRSKDYVELSEDELAAFLAPHLPKAVSARLLAARPEGEL